ncbi:uncharacterized protein DS421_16g537920 [Arachis hypogaea]|nr:uncharacterized protein DS421_16g537920 [Arachis hypogaea]
MLRKKIITAREGIGSSKYPISQAAPVPLVNPSGNVEVDIYLWVSEEVKLTPFSITGEELDNL